VQTRPQTTEQTHGRYTKTKFYDEELKLDKLEQYDRWHYLEIADVPCTEGENVTKLVLDLAS